MQAEPFVHHGGGLSVRNDTGNNINQFIPGETAVDAGQRCFATLEKKTGLIVYPVKNRVKFPQILCCWPCRISKTDSHTALHFRHTKLFVRTQAKILIFGLDFIREYSIQSAFEVRRDFNLNTINALHITDRVTLIFRKV